MRRLYEVDKEKILNYALKEPEYNIFLIGNIENYNIDGDDVQAFTYEKDTDLNRGKWGKEDYGVIVLKFFSFFIVYSSNNNYDYIKVGNFLKNQTIKSLSGKTEIIEKLHPFIIGIYKKSYLSKLSKIKWTPEIIDTDIKIKKLALEDIPDYVDLLNEIEEFPTYTEKDRENNILLKQKLLQTSNDDILGAYVGNELVSTSHLAAKNKVSGMIIGVATKKQFRNKGIASNVVAKHCANALNSGLKFICLFYNNPVAGKIYNKIGFEEIGDYSLIDIV